MTRQVTEIPEQALTDSIGYEPSRSVMDRLPFRAGLATLAAVAMAGMFAESGSSAEKYANTPVGVAKELAILFSQGRYADACDLTSPGCLGWKRKNGQPWPGFYPVKVAVVPVNKVISEKYPGIKMVEVDTKSYAQNGPWCMVLQEDNNNKWKIISTRWLMNVDHSPPTKKHHPTCFNY
jgi:hypothetical protein